MPPVYIIASTYNTGAKTMDTTKLIIDLENAVNMRVMGTDTLSGMKRINADIERRYRQVIDGELTQAQAIKLVREG